MRRFSNSWAMVKASWRVLQSDKELMAIPVMSFFATVAVALLCGGGLFLSLAHNTVVTAGQSEYSPTPLTYVVGVVGYLLGNQLAQVISRSVFNSTIASPLWLFPTAIISAFVVAVVGSVAPLRRALRIEPVRVLKG